MKPTRNVPSSVRQRLLNRAKIDKRPFHELLQYYAMERFLYRLSGSAHADCFILKGALMLKVWSSSEFRSTMDIDMLGRTSNEETSIIAQIRDIMAVDVEPDGLTFNPDSIQSERITEDADYEGIRIRFRGSLDSARVSMQIDIGFGDIVYPGPVESDLPTMLGSPVPRLLCYSRESAIAEKFEAMAKLGALNSRMKDFYDIWLLSRQFDFDGAKLAEAIRLTFERRGTVMPVEIEAFDEPFISAKQIQWSAFWKRLQQDHVPVSFRDIVSAVETFLVPVASTTSQGTTKPMSWIASGPWT
ncbi:MAG: nucleotidyl transferase AbiEii/AbiGii toxin family protein [Pseudomonadota bacterium]